MRRRLGGSRGRLTAEELVDVVERAGLSELNHDPEWEAERRRRLCALLEDLGYDGVTYVRARVAVRHPEMVAAGYVRDDASS